MVKRRARWRAGEKAQRSRPPTPSFQLPPWDATSVRALRRHLGLTQVELAEELGTRQATISEWEHGVYQPRGTSARVLGLLAERAGFEYQTRRTGEGYIWGRVKGKASSNDDTPST